MHFQFLLPYLLLTVSLSFSHPSFLSSPTLWDMAMDTRHYIHVHCVKIEGLSCLHAMHVFICTHTHTCTHTWLEIQNVQVFSVHSASLVNRDVWLKLHFLLFTLAKLLIIIPVMHMGSATAFVPFALVTLWKIVHFSCRSPLTCSVVFKRRNKFSFIVFVCVNTPPARPIPQSVLIG